MYFFTVSFAMRYRFIGAAMLAALSVAALAAEPQPTVAPEVVVTATRFEEPATAPPVGLTVISSEDIANSTAKTVPELLRQVPGIQVRDNTGSPNWQVDMRGFGIFGDQNTLVLLDGQRISEDEQASVNWEAIPLVSIERIEIMRGSGAVMYGGGATGGTINIITKIPKAGTISGYAGVDVASFNSQNYRVGANVAGQDVGLALSAHHEETDNYRDGNQLRDQSVQADLQWGRDRNKSYMRFGADAQDLQLPGSLTEKQIKEDPRQSATPGDFSRMYDGHINVGGTAAIGDADFAVDLGYRGKTVHAAYFVATPSSDAVDTQVNSWSATPRLRLPIRMGGFTNTIVGGVDWNRWAYDTTLAFGSFTGGHPVAGQRDIAWYGEDTLELPTKTTISVGGRRQRTTFDVTDDINFAKDSKMSNLEAYQVAARQKFGDYFSVYGKFGDSFRVANVNDNYNLFSGMVNLLEPQTSHDKEVGAEVKTDHQFYRVAFYQMDIRNEIHLDPYLFNNVNLPPTRRYGVELEGKWSLTNELSAFANYTYAVAKFREGSFGGVDVSGKYVPLVPQDSANLGVMWEFMKGTKAVVDASYVGEQYYDGDETNTFGQKMPDYTLVNAKLSTEIRGWLASVGIKNLFDEKYYSYGVYTGFPTFNAYPEPTRTWFASLQYTYQ